MPKKISNQAQIRKFLDKVVENDHWFWGLFKPLTDSVWRTHDNMIGDLADDCTLNPEYLQCICDRKIVLGFISEKNDDDTYSFMLDGGNHLLIINENHFDFVCEYDEEKQDEDQEKLQNSINTVLPQSQTASTPITKGIMSVTSIALDGIKLGVGKRASLWMKDYAMKQLKKMKVPDNVLDNEFFQAFILVAGPTVLQFALTHIPQLRNKIKAPIQDVINLACISSVAEVSEQAISQVEKFIGPIVKELGSEKFIKMLESPKKLKNN